MSKPVKKMIQRTYAELFEGVNDAVLVDIRGMAANDNNALRLGLAEKQIKITVVKNALAKKVFAESGLAPAADLIGGPTALVYGGESVVNVARELIAVAKKYADLEFKGAVMEGTVFGPDQVVALSKYPTKEEAQSQIIQVVLAPAGQVIGAATSAGANIASILKALEEKLEKGEAIQKIA